MIKQKSFNQDMTEKSTRILIFSYYEEIKLGFYGISSSSSLYLPKYNNFT